MTAMLLKQLHAPPALTERRYRTFADISYRVLAYPSFMKANAHVLGFVLARFSFRSDCG